MKRAINSVKWPNGAVNEVKARLAGSNLRQEGRLEVRYNGTWGTVTDDAFSDVDARVFCYMLGFG